MMAFVEGSDIGKELCLILGEKSDRVYKIVIEAKPHNVASVWVGRYLESDELHALKSVLSEYKLVLKNEIELDNKPRNPKVAI